MCNMPHLFLLAYTVAAVAQPFKNCSLLANILDSRQIKPESSRHPFL